MKCKIIVLITIFVTVQAQQISQKFEKEAKFLEIKVDNKKKFI